MVDAILQRNGIKGSQNESEFFSCMLKSFFLSLRGDDENAKLMLGKARLIKAGSNYTDLEVIRKFVDNMKIRIDNKHVVIRTD